MKQEELQQTLEELIAAGVNIRSDEEQAINHLRAGRDKDGIYFAPAHGNIRLTEELSTTPSNQATIHYQGNNFYQITIPNHVGKIYFKQTPQQYPIELELEQPIPGVYDN